MILDLSFERIDEASVLSGFYCGVLSMDVFIHEKLQEYLNQTDCIAYVIKAGMDSGIIAGLKVPMIVLGVLVGVLGLFIWLYALFVSRIDDGIRNNRLVTDGIYAWCRNPLYTGWMFICIGVSMLSANLWMLVLPFIFWALMAFMMKLTEERWLHNLYGAQYEDYCRRVNRTWPWFPTRIK